MSGVLLETCWALNKLWNNKFYYKAGSCWYFYWIIHDARIHKYQIYFTSLHVSGDCVPIIRRNNYIYATLGTKCRINIVIYPQDGHTVARNM
jgi:hypothetical protein